MRADTRSSVRVERDRHWGAVCLVVITGVGLVVACVNGDGTEAPASEADGVSVGGWFLDVDWRALGTEPFWGVYIRRSGLTFSEPGADPVEFPSAEPRRAGDGFVVSSSLDGRGLEVSLRPAVCSDGMSDRRYEWSARVEIGERRLEGCAIRDPLPTVIPADGPIAAAGLADHVESARRLLAEGGRYERVEGTLGRQRGADADFVAWFEGEVVVAIDLRVARGPEPLFETSYFFEPSGLEGETVLRLVDADAWNDRTGEHTAYLMGFGPDGSLTGILYAVDGRPADPEPGLDDAELAGARDLLDAATKTRADQRRRNDRRI